MAQKTIIETVSDLSRKPDAETVAFGYQGIRYEIDLTADEAGALAELLKPYLTVARKMSDGNKKVKERKAGKVGKTEVRRWARENGYDVGERGRIPEEVQQAYDRAHP